MPLFADIPIPESTVFVSPNRAWNSVSNIVFKDVEIALKSLFPITDVTEQSNDYPDNTQLFCIALSNALKTHYGITAIPIPAGDVSHIAVVKLSQHNDDQYTLQLNINFFLYYENLVDGKAGDTHPHNGSEVETFQLSITFLTDEKLVLKAVLMDQATESLWWQAAKSCNLL